MVTKTLFKKEGLSSKDVFSVISVARYGPAHEHSRRNKCQYWQINFVEALEEFPTYFIQSETSTRAREYSKSNHASKYVMLLGNFWDEHRGLSPI